MEVEEKASLVNEKDQATFGIQKSRIKFEVVAELFLINKISNCHNIPGPNAV